MITDRITSRTHARFGPISASSIVVTGLLLLGVIIAGGVIPAVERANGNAQAAPGQAPGRTGCEGTWPPTAVSCDEARLSISTGMSPMTAVHVWLTTLAAVDGYFHPKRQVADHPQDPMTPVWLFIYEGDQAPILVPSGSGALVDVSTEGRLLHVVAANDPATTGGAFIYVYGWRELGSPAVPVQLPTPVGATSP